jgi:hypothetical protein
MERGAYGAERRERSCMCREAETDVDVEKGLGASE